jgi:hypothetical protein
MMCFYRSSQLPNQDPPDQDLPYQEPPDQDPPDQDLPDHDLPDQDQQDQDPPSRIGVRPKVITQVGLKGSQKIFYFGRSYIVDKMRAETLYLKCSTKKCAGRAKKRLNGERLVCTRDHTACQPDHHRHLVEQARRDCLQQLQSSLASPKVIYDIVMSQYSKEVSAKWPYSTAQSFIVAHRKKNLPTLPKTFGELLANLEGGVYPAGIQSVYIGSVTLTRGGKCYKSVL